jgi:hypothetical protein
MPLQDIPQTFSSMHTWHMANPQRQRQLKKASLPQQWQAALRAIRRRALDDEVFAEEVFMIDLDAAVHDNIDSRVGEHPGGLGILYAELHPEDPGPKADHIGNVGHDLVAGPEGVDDFYRGVDLVKIPVDFFPQDLLLSWPDRQDPVARFLEVSGHAV